MLTRTKTERFPIPYPPLFYGSGGGGCPISTFVGKPVGDRVYFEEQPIGLPRHATHRPTINFTEATGWIDDTRIKVHTISESIATNRAGPIVATQAGRE